MEGKKFVELLRKVIREEVRTVVKEELKAFKPTIVENATKVLKTVSVKNTPPQPNRLITPPEPKFTGPLASILAETYEAMIKEPQVEDPEAAWPDMNGGVVTTSNMPGGMGASMASMMDSNFDSKLNTQEGSLPPLMRDYSSILKKADDIANNKR